MSWNSKIKILKANIFDQQILISGRFSSLKFLIFLLFSHHYLNFSLSSHSAYKNTLIARNENFAILVDYSYTPWNGNCCYTSPTLNTNLILKQMYPYRMRGIGTIHSRSSSAFRVPWQHSEKGSASYELRKYIILYRLQYSGL